MKVRLLVSRAGAGFVCSAGDEVEVSDAEAKRLIESNKAAPARESAEPERAVARKKVARKKVSHAVESRTDD